MTYLHYIIIALVITNLISLYVAVLMLGVAVGRAAEQTITPPDMDPVVEGIEDALSAPIYTRVTLKSFSDLKEIAAVIQAFARLDHTHNTWTWADACGGDPGCQLVYIGGNHDIWVNPVSNTEYLLTISQDMGDEWINNLIAGLRKDSIWTVGETWQTTITHMEN